MTTSHRTGPRFSRSRWFLDFLVFLAVSIYMLLTEPPRALPGRAATWSS